ncbi:hypothetical protein VN97_g11100 [Penicillium thymicola]|uniref:Uncharacterized protein n=1 Tax=Penicillium thymicola TaxID=293382 RepID=A0AAI9X3S2_PENTH|nr:hypothetical protein VN97_g11100 [Penicillium thymicola]
MLEGWEKRARRKRVYPTGHSEKQPIDKVFDNLKAQSKLDWATEHTPTGYPVFVAYRDVIKNGVKTRVGRPVVDLRDANAEAVKDMYPVPTQDDILQLCHGKDFITVFDAAAWFYQWRVHSNDVGKLGVITHIGHEVFTDVPL